MNIVFITSGVMPVPAVRGGAVEALTDALVLENESSTSSMTFTFFSIEDELAEEYVSKMQFEKSNYEFIKIPKAVKHLDTFIYLILNNIFKISYAKKMRFVFQRLYFIWVCHCKLQRNPLYDKIIVENHPSLLRAVIGTKYHFKKDVFYYAHNDIKDSYTNVKLLKKCYKIITVSNYLKNAIQIKIGSGSTEFVVIKNGIDLDLFHPFTEKEQKLFRLKSGFLDTDILILFVGRIVPEKGIKHLIEVFNKIVSYNTHLKLLIVGSNSFDLQVQTTFEKQLIQLTQGKDNVFFTGFVPNEKLPYYYNVADIVILPSIWNEPAGLTMIEALACGSALITTSAGGIREYVKESNAIQLDTENQNFNKQLEAAMQMLINNNEKRRLMSLEAPKSVDKLSYHNYYKNFSAIFCKERQLL